MNSATLSKGLLSGAAGAGFLTALHESVRHVLPDAPRVDLIAMRALAKPIRLLGARMPTARTLHRTALVGDLISNSAYYSLVALGPRKGFWLRAAALGLLAGVGAVFMPPYLGLGQQPSRRFGLTATLTIGWYFSGAMVAAAVYRTGFGFSGISDLHEASEK